MLCFSSSEREANEKDSGAEDSLINQIIAIQSLAQGFLNIRLTGVPMRSNFPQCFFAESWSDSYRWGVCRTENLGTTSRGATPDFGMVMIPDDQGASFSFELRIWEIRLLGDAERGEEYE
jgi:hypothetical protein